MLLYWVVAFFVFIFTVITVYHIIATGALTLTSFSVTVCVVLLMIATVAATGIALGSADQSASIILLGGSSLPSL